MNDHQDSENFSYSRSWADIENLLDEAEAEQNRRWLQFQNCPKPLRMQQCDLKMSKNKVLGRERK